MSVSIEALAMAGVDYLDYTIETEEWETPPPHLLAEEEKDRQENKNEVKISQGNTARSKSFFSMGCICGSFTGNSPVSRNHPKREEVESVSSKRP